MRENQRSEKLDRLIDDVEAARKKMREKEWKNRIYPDGAGFGFVFKAHRWAHTYCMCLLMQHGKRMQRQAR